MGSSKFLCILHRFIFEGIIKLAQTAFDSQLVDFTVDQIISWSKVFDDMGQDVTPKSLLQVDPAVK